MTSANGDATSLTAAPSTLRELARASPSPFRRIAIINRGEAAVRLIRAVRELNDERDLGLRAIALHTEPDRRALFVREADEAYDLGPAVSVTADGSRRLAYVDLERLAAALQRCRADAAWVGWGFVAERPEFAELCARLGVTFIGPDPASLRLLGNKIAAKRFAESCGIPVAPWGGGPVGDLDSAHLHASLVGYPLLIKAAEGGGGRGIRLVEAGHELGPALERARGEATSTFGDETTFLEKVLRGARHVEVQVVGDGTGTVWPLGVRDCSLQRRHQKVIEESASAALDASTEARLREWAVMLCARAAYRGTATVEFLVDAATDEVSFLEVNPRLQVEHPVTEAVTGCDIVKLQLDVAMGARLTGKPPEPRGHAIEARLYAEDPDRDFVPSPGVVELLRLPSGPGIRVDTGIAEGDEIAPDYDPMIAKVVAWGRDRDEALARLRRALDETVVVLRGGATNLPFLLRVLAAPEVRGGAVDVGWLDRAGRPDAARPHADVALLLAAAEVDEAELAVERTRLFTSASRGRPQVPERIGRDVELRLGGQTYRLHLDRQSPDTWEVSLDGRHTGLRVRRRGRYLRWVRCLGGTYRAICVEQGNGFRVEVQGTAHTVTRDSGGLRRAPWPALVVDVKVSPGDRVTAGSVLAVLEAMKLETPIVAEAAGVVSAVLVSRNTQVDAGTPLFQIDPSTDEPAPAPSPTERVSLSAAPAEAEDSGGGARQGLEALLRLMLGYDVGAAAADAAVRAWRSGSGTLEEEERRVLQAFADISALSERHPPPDIDGGSGRSLQEQFFNHLRRLVPDPESAELAAALRRALRHFGIAGLQRTPELEDALFWIMRSQQRAALQVPVVLALLERLLERRRDAGGGEEALRSLLDDLIQAARHRHPAVLDRARELRHCCFDQPLIAAAQRRVYALVAENLTRLEGSCDGPERERRIADLVDCPQPLHNVLSARFATAGEPLRTAMLEVMTRRYYRTRAIGAMRVLEVGGRLTALGEIPLAEQGHGHVVTTFAVLAELPAALRSLGEALAGVGDEDTVADVYAWSDEPLPAPDELARDLRRTLASTPLPPQVRRVVFAATAPGHGQGMAASQHLSFRRAAAGYREEPLYRSLHPMMGERLELWRMRRFRIQRLASPEDIYLFRGVARDDPGDERLFALAEVRDLSPVRDGRGRVVALPTLEEMLLQALAGIRAAQSGHVSGSGLQWNRVLLYVWPPLTLSGHELYGVIHRLAPETVGLGIEKIVVRARMPGTDGEPRDTVIEFSTPLGTGVSMLRYDAPTNRPIQPLSDHRRKVAAMRRRGLHHPTDILSLLAPSSEATTGGIAPGHFREYDLNARGRLKPVRRAPGANTANLVVGLIRNFTAEHPEGMRRVIILGDPSRSLGALAEPECRRIIAAIDLAERRGLPLEWFALSSGARISMDSGTENMDWIARVLRRIVRFTQAGGEINVVVAGINVGAQPYWNAEATMLMHTRGILVMTPEGAMVLTGKEALDYSGGVSAEDNFGIGGFERVMGPNGQAQYWAPDLASACHLLLRHYEHTYRASGERFPRRAVTADPLDRDVRDAPHPSHPGSGFTRVGDIFSDELNPGRKKPFDIRAVMAAVVDNDHPPLERWGSMRHAEIAVVWDAHLGGWPVCLIGLESRPLPRRGYIPADGPDQWTAGTLFPLSSKKVARAINAASRNRPVVVLANLSGFDGSPESMRRLQLEFGAEIGRAVVNFEGPMVFSVISRYHGGAFVVFSAALNESLEVAAVEGSFASVIGGAPAAAVVFGRDVEARTRSDPRIAERSRTLPGPRDAEESADAARMAALLEEVRNEKRGEVARAFDSVHTIERAQEVGSVHRIVAARDLRPYLVDAVERGIARELRRCGARR